MKTILAFSLLIALNTSAQTLKPANGTYTYKLCYIGHAHSFNTCTVDVKNDTVTIYADYYLSVPKGEIIEKGILMQHKSGKWIIAQKPEDVNADKIGGYNNGPTVIDFKTKRYWSDK